MTGTGGDGGRERAVVPPAEFRSYYGRPVLKPPVWGAYIPAYLFTGGLTAGSAVLAAGADLTGRAALRRTSRLSALAALLASMYFLVADLGRPERFHHMLRVAKPSSPMSVGTWILTAYGPGVGLAAAAELLPKRWAAGPLGRLLGRLARPAGLSGAAVAPALASYTAVLLSHTAVPAWNESRGPLPFVFTGSAAASAGGLAMILTPVSEAGPARWFAATGALGELAAAHRIDTGRGLASETFTTGSAGRQRRWSSLLTAAGLAATLLGARRSRAVAAACGGLLLAGGVLQRFGIYHAGVASTTDPRYVVGPQRERLQAEQAPNDASAPESNR